MCFGSKVRGGNEVMQKYHERRKLQGREGHLGQAESRENERYVPKTM